MYQLVSAPLTGVSQPEGWAQVVSHPQQCFVCAIALHGASAHQLGHEFTQLCLSTELHSALELHQFTERLLQRCQAEDVALQFASQLLTDQSSVMCTFNGIIYLRRDDKIGLILPAQEKIQIVEGKTHADDVYVLTTAATAVYEPQLQKILHDTHDSDAFVTQLMQHVLQMMDSSLVAAAYVQVVPVAFLATNDDGTPENPGLAMAPASELSQVQTSATQFGKENKQTAHHPAQGIKQLFGKGKNAGLAVVSAIRQIVQPLVSRDVYVRQQSTKKIIRVLVPAVIILVVIIGAIFFIRAQQAKQLQQAQTVIKPAETELTQIQQIANDQPIQARQRTETLMAMLQGKVSQLNQQKTAQSAVQKELDKVKDYYQTISGQQNVNVLPTFFDLRLFNLTF